MQSIYIAAVVLGLQSEHPAAIGSMCISCAAAIADLSHTESSTIPSGLSPSSCPSTYTLHPSCCTAAARHSCCPQAGNRTLPCVIRLPPLPPHPLGSWRATTSCCLGLAGLLLLLELDHLLHDLLLLDQEGTHDPARTNHEQHLTPCFADPGQLVMISEEHYYIGCNTALQGLLCFHAARCLLRREDWRC